MIFSFKITLSIVLSINFFTFAALASTIGIATGSRTGDGRPLLFKNKDRTDNYPSDVNFYQGSFGEYDFVFQVNAGQDHTRARMGINSAGFGIVYSTSENLAGAASGPSASQLSAIALKTCSTINQFRELLEETNGARTVHEHFAVIDSTGIGSLFEVDGYSYVEIPIIDSIGTMANTAKYHPSAGLPASGSTSPDREARATYLLTHGDTVGLNYRYFIEEIIQDFSHTQEDEDVMPVGEYLTNPVLSRYKTACGGVIQGCLAQDDPRVEIMLWLALGEPSLSIVLPFSPNVDEVFDFIRPYSTGDGMAGACDRMRQIVYDYTDGRYADRYADTFHLLEIRQQTFALQDSIFSSYETRRSVWRGMDSTASESDMISWTYATQNWAKSEYENIFSVLQITPVDDQGTRSFSVFQNFPNPFNSSTQIQFRNELMGSVKISIFDITGRIVREWDLGTIPSGDHSLSFIPRTDNLNAIAAGVYFYRIAFNNHSIIKKMIYLP